MNARCIRSDRCGVEPALACHLHVMLVRLLVTLNPCVCSCACRSRFTVTTMKLIGVAILCGIFTGIRGGMFSVAMWRLKVRICNALFASLLAQEIGFFDKVQTGGLEPSTAYRQLYSCRVRDLNLLDLMYAVKLLPAHRTSQSAKTQRTVSPGSIKYTISFT